MAVVTVAFSELDSWLQAQPENTADTPYELNITGLTTSDIGISVTVGTLGNVVMNNSNKFVDLSETILPSVTNMDSCFSRCTSLVTAPSIPNSVTSMNGCFNECKSLVTAPSIPDGVTNMQVCFFECTSLTTAPNIPSGVTNMYGCFYKCKLLVTAPNIPDSVTDMDSCFSSCTSLTTAPSIPDGVTRMNACFTKCTSLTTAPIIPDRVTSMDNCFNGCTSLTTAPVIPDRVIYIGQLFEGCTSLTIAPVIPNSVTYMYRCFEGCTSLVTAPNIPSGVTNIERCFNGCSSLEEITLFEVDLESLVTNYKAEKVFSGCTSLTKIVVPSEPATESDWHAYRLKFDATTVQGKVYDQTGTAVTIPQTSVTKSTLKLPIKTDELWFPNGYTDAQIDEMIQKVIQYRYTFRNDNDVLDPAEKNFVLWADDPDKVKSNILPEIEYPIPESKGGTGQTSLANVTVGNATAATSAEKLTTARTVYVKLGTASTSETKDFSGTTAIPVNGTLKVANGGTGMTTASYKNAVVVGNSSTVTNALRTIRTASGAFYATAQDGAPTFGTLPVGQGGTGATSLANITVGNSSKLGNISVQTTSIGGGTYETGNHWAYVTRAHFYTSSGYIVYSNGLKIQWGKCNPTGSNSQGPWSFTFTNLFTEPPIVMCQRGALASRDVFDNSGRESNTWKVTASNFYFDSNVGYTTKNYFWYFAIGW